MLKVYGQTDGLTDSQMDGQTDTDEKQNVIRKALLSSAEQKIS